MTLIAKEMFKVPPLSILTCPDLKYTSLQLLLRRQLGP